MDLGTGTTSSRKLSLTVHLSDPGEYEGGELQFFPTGDHHATSFSRGSMTSFPSYLEHRVTPVTRGIRRSLVAWAYGPRYL